MGNICNTRKKSQPDNNNVLETTAASNPNDSPEEPVSNVPPTNIPPPTKPKPIVVALYDYEASDSQNITFKKGDRMAVLADTGDWLKVIHLGNQMKGYIPGNYVAVEKSIESEDWFFGNILRAEAQNLLLSAINPRGTFLIRQSEQIPKGYCLSIKDWNESRGYHIKHYRIKVLDNGRFYISPNQTFDNLSNLVNAYTINANGICHVLSHICKRPQPSIWDLGYMYKDKWEISRDQITLERILGKGNFGEVYYGKWKNTIEVAVKTMKEGSMSTDAFLQEATVMKSIKHNKLVALYGICSEKEPIYIVQEYVPGDSLLSFLRKHEEHCIEFEDLIYIAFQVASGMKYLESKQFIHRDLAARNVLIGENNIVKICDFGLARLVDNSYYQCKANTRFPVKWTAPEAILHGKFSIKSDVWSYGILLMEIFTLGEAPYPGMISSVVVTLLETGYRMPQPTTHYVPDAIYNTMLNCWDAIPEKRPTFEFLEHYFKEFNVTSELAYKEVPN